MSEEHRENSENTDDPVHEGTQPIPANTDRSSPQPIKKGMRWLEILVILAIIGVLIGLFLPSVNSSPRPGRRLQCMINQKQITLALLNYEAEKGHFPPAFIPDINGKPMHSWRVLILPYLERKDLYDQYDFNEPWDGPHNRKLADKMPRIFACPSNPDAPNCTAYAMLVGPHAFSPGPLGRKLDEISAADGASNTLMLVEAAGAKINWLEPRDLNVEEMSFTIGKDGREISSRHPGGSVVSFCDGHQSFLRTDIKPDTLKALTTIDGGEPVDEGEY